jgi:hypothetical protein
MRGSGKIANSLARLVEGFLAGAFVLALVNFGASGAEPEAGTPRAPQHASLDAKAPAKAG